MVARRGGERERERIYICVCVCVCEGERDTTKFFLGVGPFISFHIFRMTEEYSKYINLRIMNVQNRKKPA